jgi:spore maturation protein CgeB
MKKILYIGTYSEGTTTKMRGNSLQRIFSETAFQIINIDIPFYQSPKIARSIGFRYKIGPIINKINSYIIKNIQDNYDMIWVDKAVFITKTTTKILKQRTKILIHYTPDPAFQFHHSHHFESSISLYDYAITTKMFEQPDYQKFLKPEQIIFSTQGFDPSLHSPITPFNQKKNGVVFIGHNEKEREKAASLLLKNNIPLAIAGINWKTFAKKNKNNPLLNYMGDSIYGTNYTKILSEYYFSWGAISKWIPEKHTTRTFEIPACGTALITERNNETIQFFNEQDVIFYSSFNEMIDKIKYYLEHLPELEVIIQNGLTCIKNKGFDYDSLIKKIMNEIMGI